MGFSPREIDRMGWWQFAAALHGWRVANGQADKAPAAMDESALREMGIEGF
jgi:hypothetical protein